MSWTEYDGNGDPVQAVNEIFDNEVTYTGSITDTSTGWQYMNARYYDSSTGRFLTQDTYTGSPYVPWTQHLYSYCGNNPTNMIDPTGHVPSFNTMMSDGGNTRKRLPIYFYNIAEVGKGNVRVSPPPVVEAERARKREILEDLLEHTPVEEEETRDVIEQGLADIDNVTIVSYSTYEQDQYEVADIYTANNTASSLMVGTVFTIAAGFLLFAVAPAMPIGLSITADVIVGGGVTLAFAPNDEKLPVAGTYTDVDFCYYDGEVTYEVDATYGPNQPDDPEDPLGLINPLNHYWLFYE